MITVDPVYPLNIEVVYGEVPLLIINEQVHQTENQIEPFVRNLVVNRPL